MRKKNYTLLHKLSAIFFFITINIVSRVEMNPETITRKQSRNILEIGCKSITGHLTPKHTHKHTPEAWGKMQNSLLTETKHMQWLNYVIRVKLNLFSPLKQTHVLTGRWAEVKEKWRMVYLLQPAWPVHQLSLYFCNHPFPPAASVY